MERLGPAPARQGCGFGTGQTIRGQGMTEIFELIQQRTAISASVDEEFAAVPGEPRKRRIYDWDRRQWRTVITIDLGAKRIQRPPTELDGINSKRKQSIYAVPRPQPQRDKVWNWLRDNPGQMFRTGAIAAGADVPEGTARQALSDGMADGVISRIKDPDRTMNGFAWVWGWIDA